MNKRSNLSMMVSLLFVCISMSNVYGVDGPWKFKLKLGQLTSHLNRGSSVTGLYYQLECIERADGTGKWIWKSTEDGYDYTDTTDTTQLDEFEIRDQGTILTPWYIETSDYYYGCDLYLYQSLAAPLNDAEWGHGKIGTFEINNMDMKEEQHLVLADPNEEMKTFFDVELYGEAQLYPGPWKFELSLDLLSNLDPIQTFTSLYYQLLCYEERIISDDDKDTSIKFTSTVDGYNWYYYKQYDSIMHVVPFDIGKGGDDDGEITTNWYIESKDKDGKDLYFYHCDLWIVQKRTGFSDSYLARSSVPLITLEEEFKTKEMYFYKPGADPQVEPAMFHLTYGASQGRVELPEKEEL